jgi:hypothetical protein
MLLLYIRCSFYRQRVSIESLQLILLIILLFYRQRASMTVRRAQAVTILCQDVVTAEDPSSRLVSF